MRVFLFCLLIFVFSNDPFAGEPDSLKNSFCGAASPVKSIDDREMLSRSGDYGEGGSFEDFPARPTLYLAPDPSTVAYSYISFMSNPYNDVYESLFEEGVKKFVHGTLESVGRDALFSQVKRNQDTFGGSWDVSLISQAKEVGTEEERKIRVCYNVSGGERVPTFCVNALLTVSSEGIISEIDLTYERVEILSARSLLEAVSPEKPD